MSAVRSSRSQKLKIRYNAPVTLTFSFLAVAVFILNLVSGNNLNTVLFTASSSQAGDFPFNPVSIIDYINLFTHVLGHSSWNHLISNLSFILLLGPMLEERFSSIGLLIMILITAFATGVVNACFISTGLMGASGIAFMMILLASFTNFEKNEIPLTFLLIVVLYIGREIFASFEENDVSEFAHLIGGICGSMFGFFAGSTRRKIARKPRAKKTTVSKAAAAKRLSEIDAASPRGEHVPDFDEP